MCSNHRYNYFHIKISLKLLVKHLLRLLCTQSFFVDHLQYKTVNNANSRTLSANPRQLCAHSTAQKMKFSIKDFFSKCDQILSFLRI